MAREVDLDFESQKRPRTTCPMCLEVIQGDPDVIEAHVDSCLAHAMRVQEQPNAVVGDTWEEVDVDDNTVMRATDGANLIGKF